MPTSSKRTSKKAAPPSSPQERRRPADKYSPTAWGAGPSGEYHDLTVPSGQLCQARRPGTQGLIKAGVLHEMDVLTPLIQQHKDAVQGKRKNEEVGEQEIMALLSDETKSAALFHLLDRVVVHCVVQPEIHMTPNDPTNRESGVVYADMVDLEDKIFILNWALGGSRDLERFRDESSASVGGVSAQPEDAGTTE